MKIAHIAPPWFTIPPKNYGGTEIVVYNLVEEQVAQGHEVTLFAPADARTSAKLVSFFDKSLQSEGIPWSEHLMPYYHMHKSVEYIKEHAFDIVHTHLSSSSDLYIFPLLAPLATPHVTTLHSRFPFDRVQNWTGQADAYFMEWAPTLPMVAISESARAGVPYPLNFVGVVHHGLPIQECAPSAKAPDDYFVWLGRFVRDKAPHLALQAAKEAGVQLVLAGTLDRHLKDELNYFHETVEPQVDNEQFKYIGPVNMKEKVRLLSRARGLLNPIEWEEPFGMVMIEAMALGCPVISFARGAAPEIVVHRKTGFLVHDLDEMVRFIPRIGEIDREVTRQHVERNFSVRVMASKYEKTYIKVMAAAKNVKPRPFPVLPSSTTMLTPGSNVVKKVVPAQLAHPVQIGQPIQATLVTEG